MGGGKSVSLKGRAGERADEEEAGEGMRCTVLCLSVDFFEFILLGVCGVP